VAFERCEGDVGAQRERVAELDHARQEGARRVGEARAALLESQRAREANRSITDLAMAHGEAIVVETGVPREDELIEAVREAENGLSLRAVTLPHGGGVSDVELRVVDEMAEARYEGAVEALQAAEDRLHQFAASHFAELEVERAPRAGSAQRRVANALAEFRAATAEFEAERNWQTRLCNAAGRQDLIEDLPANPGAWLAEAPREVPPPMPESLTA
jgi:hypothetical protein